MAAKKKTKSKVSPTARVGASVGGELHEFAFASTDRIKDIFEKAEIDLTDTTEILDGNGDVVDRNAIPTPGAIYYKSEKFKSQ